jgi:MFS family permease
MTLVLAGNLAFLGNALGGVFFGSLGDKMGFKKT